MILTSGTVNMFKEGGVRSRTNKLGEVNQVDFGAFLRSLIFDHFWASKRSIFGYSNVPNDRSLGGPRFSLSLAFIEPRGHLEAKVSATRRLHRYYLTVHLNVKTVMRESIKRQLFFHASLERLLQGDQGLLGILIVLRTLLPIGVLVHVDLDKSQIVGILFFGRHRRWGTVNGGRGYDANVVYTHNPLVA